MRRILEIVVFAMLGAIAGSPAALALMAPVPGSARYEGREETRRDPLTGQAWLYRYDAEEFAHDETPAPSAEAKSA